MSGGWPRLGPWLPAISGCRILTGALVVVVVAAVGMSTFLWAYGVRDTASYDEDAVIVLGAAVHGDELSPTLRGRLNAALTYHRRNPDALIVVAGGKGSGENISEAEAMQHYLIGANVPPELIIAEDRSTSTQENFANSGDLLNARLDPGYRVAFVTNEFHVYRAGRLAASAGLTAGSVHSTTPFYFWAPMYLRECLAVVASWLR